MRAVVQLLRRGDAVPAQRVIAHHGHARLLHLLDVRTIDFPGAEAVDHDVDLDAARRALGQGVGEIGPDLARPVNIALEVDGLLRRADRLEHRRENALAVHQRGGGVPGDDGRAEQAPHHARELRIGDGSAAGDFVGTLGRVLRAPACGDAKCGDDSHGPGKAQWSMRIW